MRPHTSYLICATPRSGSFLLCEALKNTNLAGRPEEYFWRNDGPFWRERWRVSSDADYVSAAIEQGTTPNGVFGAKVMWGYMDGFIGKLREASGNHTASTHELLAVAFPNLRYVWMMRRDKVRQAVSFSKAIQTGVWAWTSDEAPEPTPNSVFDLDQIDGLLREIEDHESAWQRYFASCGIEPLRVVYEDLARDYKATVMRVLEYLEIPVTRNLRFGKRRMKRQSDAISEEWVDRYRARIDSTNREESEG